MPKRSVTPQSHREILCFATKGAGTNEEDRIRILLDPLGPSVWPFDRSHKIRSGLALVIELARHRPDLVVMEGTGLAGGLALLFGRIGLGIPYVVSSGDAVGPFLALKSPVLGPIGGLFERVLCAMSAGFIGWTPYLVGRALTFGAPRAVTAENWSLHGRSTHRRQKIRAKLGLDPNTLVFGLIGALVWTKRRGYCYGLELVRAITRTAREDVAVVIVGDGDGLPHLRRAAGVALGSRVLLPGPIPYDEVPAYLSALDILSLPQSVDRVGALRYTTKLSEYVAAGRPVVTGQLPLAYDLDDGWLWRLPGDAPWDERYVDALAALMESVTHDEVDRRQGRVPSAPSVFDGDRQQRRVSAFIADICDEAKRISLSGSSAPSVAASLSKARRRALGGKNVLRNRKA